MRGAVNARKIPGPREPEGKNPLPGIDSLSNSGSSGNLSTTRVG
jgi:hypothetical protein